MTVDAWATLGVVSLTLVALVCHWTAPSITVLGAMVALLVLGVTTPAEALSGFANPAPITVAALYVLAHAMEKTGAIQPLLAWAFADPGSVRNRPTGVQDAPRRHRDRTRLPRIVWSSAGASAVLNNTPIVAMLIPTLQARISPSGGTPSPWLMPISFAAILGGTVTLIGTSTNLVVSGLLESAGHPPLGMFELTPVALPMALAGIAIILRLAPRVFPEREEGTATLPPGPRRPSAVTSPGRPASREASHPAASLPAAGLVLMVTAAMVTLSAFGVLPILEGALTAALLMVAARVLTAKQAIAAIDLNVILLIAASFGMGEAIRVSGLADVIAGGLVSTSAVLGPVAVLVAVVLCTILLTEVITNNAAAVLMFPIAVAAAISIDAEPRPFAWAVALAASASFLTPVGYQTNTMVYHPGGYRFADYARLGLPVTLVVAVLVVLGVSIRWGLF
ncbi:MAG: SLC13 family permease [Gemmatimonadota bacterium]